MRNLNKTNKGQVMKSKKCKCCKCDLNNGNWAYNENYEDYCYDCGEELNVMYHQYKEEGA